MNRIFNRLSLMAKVALAPAWVLLCLLIVTAYTVWAAQATSRTLDFLTQQSLVHVTLVAQAQERAVAVNAMVMQSVAYAGIGMKPSAIRALDEKIGSELKATQKRIDRLRETLSTDSASAPRLSQLDVAFKKYTQATIDTLDMKDTDLSTAAVNTAFKQTTKASADTLDMKDTDLNTLALMMNTAESAYADVHRLLGEQFTYEVKAAEQSGERATSSLATGNQATLTLATLALLLGAVVTWLIARQIVQTLQAAVGIAREVAQGNLRQHAVQAGQDETGQVLRALGDVAQRLNGMMANIRSGADQIDTAAHEISLGNHDLASRTEHTASALQSTSSSVADLSHTIKLNAETATQAKQLAVDASRVAQQGGSDVAEVVKTMEAISAQAKRISEIIGTIDGIAFQTNILALNAAVEAARAGEQGRGFAVVASEVRSLAQRSGEAAKEIRGLIGASVEQVASGTSKVHAAGETMHRIVRSIEQVSTMVAEISRATAEQADAIHGVNEAVAEMDRNTQQNAALVEESAAAAESLRVQAAGLVQTISVFQVS